MANINILSYILSLIGFGTTTVNNTIDIVTNTNNNETSCNFLSASTLIVKHEDIIDEEKKSLVKRNLLNENVVQNWLNQLSNATLCQILSSAISDYPQIADIIHSYYFGKKEVMDHDGWATQLKSLTKRAAIIAHSLDHYRVSDQFSRASEVATSLHLLLRQFAQDLSVHGPSHAILFGLILVAQEALGAPSEVRQQIFTHDKFGRILILEMASVLKNFKLPLLPNEDWHRITYQKDNWLVALEQVCSKMARYDITWEYRKEYQDVPMIAARYFKHYAH
ncbi:hypothetical protein RMATCC62417_01928 [Rhizopus microsporus]|nr:hypothetical protein RMATCC62417_01928 [Rhizopus microsporus]